MSLPAIEVSGLSKRYVIQHESRHDNLRDTLHHSARKLWRRMRWGTGFSTEEFWALRDVSFAVQPGEVVGIVGRNGAGKSTLLKILSRITEPTAGRIALRGRVASLLEVGTGFHPDLSGRENIYLNGAILGMSRAEIRAKFDEIVAFAEVERFLDTPVKRYSSGMYVRLAFAVAAHLEPEILIVDEVLAVGDVQFQKKCLGKMQDVARNQGRTVLFVSHNLGAVSNLCQQAILLENGHMRMTGPVSQILQTYLRQDDESSSAQDLALRKDRGGNGQNRICAITLKSNDDSPTDHLEIGSPLKIELRLERSVVDPHIVCAIYDTEGRLVADFDTAALSIRSSEGKATDKIACIIHSMMLKPGRYRINLALLSSGDLHDWVEAASAFEIAPGLFEQINFTDRYRGIALLAHTWQPSEPTH